MFYPRNFKDFKILLRIIEERNYSKYPEFKKTNKKKIYLHILKSDFVIKIFFFLSLKFLTLCKLSKKNYFDFIPSFFSEKVEELFFSVVLLQSKNFDEKIKSSNFYTSKYKYKNLIIGSGPSGSITAYNLNLFTNDCLLIDGGRSFTIPKSKHPGDEFFYKWKNGGLNSTVFFSKISFSSGFCAGGGSESNSGLFHSPSSYFIENWKNSYDVAELNIDDLNKEMLNIKKICGTSFLEQDIGSVQFFLKGNKINNYRYEHVLSLYENKNLSKKNSMSNTYLRQYLNNKGEFLTNFMVRKIKKQNNDWVVYGTLGKKKIKIEAKNIFLNCGSLETNKILINSKIKGNFNNFFFHPMLKVIVEFDEEIQDGSQNVHSYQLNHFFPDFLIGEAANGEQFLKIASYKSKYSEHISKNWKKMSIYHSTFSFGKGKIFKIPFLDKFISSYKINKKELPIIQKSINILCNILYSGGAKNIYLITNDGLLRLDKCNYNEKIGNIKKVNEIKFSSVHTLGGVKSGENPICEFDSWGKYKNASGLYVYDSSLINHKLLKNPQGTIMSISNRNISKFIKENYA